MRALFPQADYKRIKLLFTQGDGTALIPEGPVLLVAQLQWVVTVAPSLLLLEAERDSLAFVIIFPALIVQQQPYFLLVNRDPPPHPAQ